MTTDHRSTEERTPLLESMRSYAEQMADSPAIAYMVRRRGISDEALIKRLGLGYVDKPSAGHERYQGFLAIPYLRYSYSGPHVATIRFVCIKDGCLHEHHSEIESLPGHGARLYNTLDLLAPTDEICVCDGEWDTITALAHGLRAVGVQNAEWRPYMAQAFRGYRRVRVFAPTSGNWAAELAAQIPVAVIEPCPNGLSLNDAHRRGDAAAFLNAPR